MMYDDGCQEVTDSTLPCSKGDQALGTHLGMSDTPDSNEKRIGQLKIITSEVTIQLKLN